MIYLTILPIAYAYTVEYWNDWSITNFKWSGRKRSWHILMYYPDIRLEEIKNTTNKPYSGKSMSRCRLEPLSFRKQFRSVTAWTRVLGCRNVDLVSEQGVAENISIRRRCLEGRGAPWGELYSKCYWIAHLKRNRMDSTCSTQGKNLTVVRMPEGKSPFASSRCKWENNIEIDPREWGTWEYGLNTHCPVRVKWPTCEHGKPPDVSQLDHYKLRKTQL
jgi:hypothetical protein